MTRKHIYTQTVSILSSFFYSSASTTLIISRFFIQFTSPFLNYSLCFSKIFFIFPAHTHPPTVRFATPIATAILCFLSKYKIKHNIYIQNICTFAFFPYLSFSHCSRRRFLLSTGTRKHRIIKFKLCIKTKHTLLSDLYLVAHNATAIINTEIP